MLHEHIHYTTAKKYDVKNIKKNFMSCFFSIPQNFISYDIAYKVSVAPYLPCLVFSIVVIYILFDISKQYIIFILFFLNLPSKKDFEIMLWKIKYFTNHKKYLELIYK